jgi:DNA-binding transcriptional LysR family regulator
VALATDFAVLASLVAVDAGVALIPAMALPDDPTGLELHPLDSPLTHNIYALTAQGISMRAPLRND